MLFAGIALVVWSGWQNLRQRRSAMQEQQNRRVDLIPDSQSAAAWDSSGGSPLKGKPAPAFTLLDLNGKKVSLSDFKGRPLVVNFWGTYCAPCKIEMPWLQEFSLKYAADVTYPILLSTPKAEKDYLSNTEALPMSFYVDKTGKVIEITAGLGSKDELEAMVKETIAAGGR
jgi:peroxiredoxin